MKPSSTRAAASAARKLAMSRSSGFVSRTAIGPMHEARLNGCVPAIRAIFWRKSG